jgi:hypothetical protein
VTLATPPPSQRVSVCFVNHRAGTRKIIWFIIIGKHPNILEVVYVTFGLHMLLRDIK